MKIPVQLNAKSIDKAIKQIEAYQKRIENLKPDFLKACAEKVRDLANANISMYDYDGAIIAEITSPTSWLIETAKDGVVTLRNTSEKATYIEFGVGQVGQDSHSEAKEVGYQYDVPSTHKWRNPITGANEWYISFKSLNGLDLREPYYEVLTSEKYANRSRTYIRTSGEPATMFLFNAFMDFVDNKLYEDIWNNLVKDL